MLSRGRVANHLYLQVAGDGDPHTINDTLQIRERFSVSHLVKARLLDGGAKGTRTPDLLVAKVAPGGDCAWYWATFGAFCAS
jgi:hypothetical protein